MVYRSIARTETVEIGDYRCAGADSSRDEIAERAELIFVRSGLFRMETERGRELVDPSRAIALAPGERYRVSHPGVCHDRCLVMSFAPEALDEVAGAARRGGTTWRPRLTLGCSDALFLAQERFRGALCRTAGDPLLAAEGALRLAEVLLRGSSEASGERNGARPDAASDRRIAAVRALLAERFSERLSLAELGAAVKLSPFRLAHLFRAATGGSLHRHRLGLRMRAAAARIGDGERDLTALALDLGFADHAHFTNSFRRRFGLSPTAFRRSLGTARLEQPAELSGSGRSGPSARPAARAVRPRTAPAIR